MVCALALAFMAHLSAGSWAHAAEQVADCRVEARLSFSESLSTLYGEASVHLVNQGVNPIKEVPIYIFPRRLASIPPGLDDVVMPRVYPDGFDPGDLVVETVRTPEGAELTTNTGWPGLLRVTLPQVAAPGERVSLVVRYRVVIPERYGPFGRVGDRVTLDGGFLPRSAPQTADGFQERSPPGRIDFALSLRVEGEGTLRGFINGRDVRLRGEPVLVRGQGEDRVSLVLAPSFRESSSSSKGAKVRYAHHRARPTPAGPDDLTDLASIDPPGQTLRTTLDVLSFLRRQFGQGPEELLIVEAPLRRDIAISAPGMLLISDRAFELSPMERFLRIHRVALARGIASSYLRTLEPLQETLERRDRARDFMAIHLSERWEQLRYGGQVGIREILGPGRFIAAVEDVIRSPQIPFQSTWFRIVDDTDRLRDRFTLFSHAHSNGRIWREKLLDKLGPDVLDGVVDRAVRGRISLFTALSFETQLDVPAFLAQWSEGAPEVNYRLVNVRAIANGVEVEVAREGESRVTEPVVIAAIGDRRRVATWDAPGERATVQISGATISDEIVIDPDFRLIESDLGQSVNARFDNKSHHRWRALLRGFGFDVNSATGRVNTAFAGSLIRSDDIRSSVSLRAYDRERTAGAQALWWRGFGPKIRASQRRFSLGAGLGVSWLKPEENTADGFGAVLSLSATDSTTVSSTAPRSGHLYSLSAGPVFAVRGAETTYGAFGIAGARGLLPLARSHVLAGRAQVGLHWGDVLDAQQWPAGGVNGVRAIDPYAARGRHRIFGSLEWRHRLFRDLTWSFLNLSWIESVDGVLFSDMASVTDNMSDLASQDGLFGGLGYGVRVHHRIAGFKPMVLSIDYGVPVLNRGAYSLPATLSGSLVVAVGQVF